VAEIAGGYAVAELQGRHSDQPIGKRKTKALCLVLAVDLPHTKSKTYRYCMTGRAVSNSWMNCLRLSCRCNVSARAAP
jgi:hypothetical protein